MHALVCFAIGTCQICLDLSTHADSVSDFDGLNARSDLDCPTNDLMSNANGERAFTPTTTDSVISFLPQSHGRISIT